MAEEQPLSIIEACTLVASETGSRPTRQTLYNWIKWGWLQTIGPYRPIRVTRAGVLNCLANYRSG